MPETPVSAAAGAWDLLLDGSMIFIGLLLILCLVRAIRGPRMADRVIAINAIGTMVVILLCILTVRLGEGWLTDVAMIYTLLSFLAVVVLTRMVIGAWRAHRGQDKGGGGNA